MKSFDVDLVYLWVDDADTEWVKKKESFGNSGSKITCRYANNDELRYSLRSVEKHLPWIRKIFIVTDNQKPEWLDVSNPKIQIVDHKEILPSEILPCFNSVLIEYFIYRIPGLSEHFLYANDDTFVNADLQPSFFFAEDGFPIIRLMYKPLEGIKKRIKELLNIRVNNYRISLENSSDIIKKKYGKRYRSTPHHNIDSYLKNDYQNLVEDTFKDEIQSVLGNRFRSHTDIQRVLFHYSALATGRGHLRYVKRKESCRIKMQKPDFQRYIDKYNPKLFCLNDTERGKDSDRKRVAPFLKQLYPEKSSFEL